jgi:general secretion pathway protein E
MTFPGYTALLLSAVLAVAATVLCMITAHVTDPSAAEPAISGVLEAAFAGEPWSLLARVLPISGAAVAALFAIERLLGLRRAGPADGRAGNLESLRDKLAHTRTRIETFARQDTNVVNIFDEIVRGAIAVSASDIHISPSIDTVAITYRVDAALHEVLRLSLRFAPALNIRAKVLARLDTQVRSTPQDGRIVMQIDDQRVDLRLSCLPTDAGERIAIRLAHGSRTATPLVEIGFRPEMLRALKDVIGRAQGMLFVTGPVGSGKTTTLYSLLQQISERRGATTSIVTLEDPIELVLPFATQTQMNERTGLKFAAVLRSALRQDPNVLMIGEIRDHETADVAVQASLTGHLILTTVHADSATGPFARLIELQVEPFALASATVGSLAQRLVRALCVHCRSERPPTPGIRERFEQYGIDLPPARYYEAAGCDACDQSGFSGRLPIAELLLVGPALRQAVHERRPTRELDHIARQAGMIPLIEDGLARAVAGETSLSEVLRVVG